MRRQGLVARRIRRRHGLTRQTRPRRSLPDLVKRRLAADKPNCLWVGDITEIPADGGKLCLATVIDLCSRRLLGGANGLHPDADLAYQAIKMAVAARGGPAQIAGVIFHTDRGSPIPTADRFTALCRTLQIRQSMGRVGSCFNNAAADAFFSSLEWEVLSRHDFTTTRQAQAAVIEWCYGFYNHQRRHSSAGGQSPINYETTTLNREAHSEPHDPGEPQGVWPRSLTERAMAPVAVATARAPNALASLLPIVGASTRSAKP